VDRSKNGVREPRYPRDEREEAMMEITYFKDTDALMINFRDAEYDESEEIFDGFVIDFDKTGRPMTIDICEASKFIDIDRLIRMNSKQAPIVVVE
jgi:uncharacterized protein YuzE